MREIDSKQVYREETYAMLDLPDLALYCPTIERLSCGLLLSSVYVSLTV